MKYYLAYGSNLNIEQMAARCPDARPVGTAEIRDYELVFRRGYLTIEPKECVSVPVGIWEISDEDEKRLDRYEGFPKFYRKEYFDVPYYDRTTSCLVYVMQDGHPLQVPSDHYFYTVMKGYRDFSLDRAPLISAYERVKWPDDE